MGEMCLMSKCRVHELAKEYHINSKVLIKKLRLMGIMVSSHMSTLENHEIDTIRDEFQKAGFGQQSYPNVQENLFGDMAEPNKKSTTDLFGNTINQRFKIKKKQSENPYVTSSPVGGQSSFIGRKDIIQEVIKLLSTPHENGIILYGQRRIGKTSILLELEANIKQQSHIYPIYFDGQDNVSLSFEQLLKKLAIQIFRNIARPPFEGWPIPNEWNEDIPSIFKETFIPHVLSKLPDHAMIVFLFDEFDALGHPADQSLSSFFSYIRQLMHSDARHFKFVFVIGHRPEDLSNLYLSLFKGVKSCHVSLFNKGDSHALIKLSEINQTLKWSDTALNRIFYYTGGHPYLTQQLCQVIWDMNHKSTSSTIVQINEPEIDQAISHAIQYAANSLEWLWDGLGPAERIVISAISESNGGKITISQLEKRLQDFGVRILSSELKKAPIILEQLNLIEILEDSYHMHVELLRQWIAQKKPLTSVHEDLDKIVPVAENLFQAAYQLYQTGAIDETNVLLRRVLDHNPNHMKSNQLLADILLLQGQKDEAQSLLEVIMEYNSDYARPRLVKLLIENMQHEQNESEKMRIIEKILTIEPDQIDAKMAWNAYWVKIGDQAFSQNQFEEALSAYQKADIQEKINHAENQIQLNTLYIDAQHALQENDRSRAIELFITIVKQDPFFRDTTLHLHKAVAKEDISHMHVHNDTMQQKINALIEENTALNKKANALELENLSLQNSSSIKEKLEYQEKIQEVEKERIELKNLQNKLKSMIDSSVAYRKEKTSIQE